MIAKHLNFRTVLFAFGFFILYLLSTVPVGLFLYSLKSEAGLNVFSNTGFHSYLYCLKEQAGKIGGENPASPEPAP